MWLYMKSLKVNEIFDSIDGEGKRAGELATFIRLTGCNLRCSYCDSTYTFYEGKQMEIDDILKQVHYKNVTLTGGEPLYQDVHELLEGLRDHEVNIETNGSMPIRPYMDMGNVFFTIDWKSKSSGVENRMYMENFNLLRERDVLKFVVGSLEELERAKYITYTIHPKCLVYISPVFGKINPADMVEYMKRNKMEQWRIQLQLHKFIWSPTKRGV